MVNIKQIFSIILPATLVTTTMAQSAPLILSSCEYQITGTSIPPTSGSPLIIDEATGTVISANFFNSGAIDPPHFDGSEQVSVCVSPFDANGERKAELTTDIGLDNDFLIKAYPEFIVGTKFGNQFETSYRYYSNNGLPPEHQWPVLSTNVDANDNPYEFANLEYVSQVQGVGLPAFTNALPNITVTLDIDEYNVVGSERDVMLESFFYDTSANASIIGNNAVTNQPVARTLNNIVGRGHRHDAQLNNAILEMMVHIGPLSPNDVSEANNNPGQNQLTETYSGKDFDGDGIDDHFDVDSHLYVNSSNPSDPSPGLYSSGVDADGDGIDDADVLPVVIGDFAYSIWYGESQAPIVIYSRETNSSLNNDFDPLTPDMDLTSEGEITLPWNDFLNYTLFNIEPLLEEAGVSWVLGSSNPFPQMRSDSGAIGGLEFGVEPQINIQSDQPYALLINKLNIEIDGRSFGLDDTTIPKALTVSPADGQTLPPDVHNISGTASDNGAGVSRIRVRIRRLGVSPALYWNGSDWTSTSSSFNEAILSNNGGTWTLPDVDLTTPANYRINLLAYDLAGNIARVADLPKSNFTVLHPDMTKPTAQTTSPAANSTVTAGILDIVGEASDDNSGVSRVRVRIRRLGVSPALYWNGSDWTSTSSSFNEAILSNNGGTWTLPDVDLTTPANYRINLLAYDLAGNIARVNDLPKSDFSTK